jgi:nicotinate-nucleotide adenylyltransferase
MGADNLSGFHRWERWQDIMRTIPVAVMARPGEQPRAGLSPAARCFAQARLPQPAAAALAGHAAPAWVLLTGRMSDASSTAIRRRGDWP